MAIYKVRLPDDSVQEIKGPDGATPEEVFEFAASQGLIERPKEVEQPTEESKEPNEQSLFGKIWEASSLPQRGIRGAAQVGKELISGSNLQESLESGREAISPDYEPQTTADKALNIASQIVDPRTLAVGGAVGKLGGKALKGLSKLRKAKPLIPKSPAPTGGNVEFTKGLENITKMGELEKTRKLNTMRGLKKLEDLDAKAALDINKAQKALTKLKGKATPKLKTKSQSESFKQMKTQMKKARANVKPVTGTQGGKPLEMEYVGYQEGFQEIPGHHLFNVIKKGHPQFRTTLTKETLKDMGIIVKVPK